MNIGYRHAPFVVFPSTGYWEIDGEPVSAKKAVWKPTELFPSQEECNLLGDTPYAFIDWLKSKQEGSYIGFANHPFDCPIAKYLNSLGDETYAVGLTTYYSRSDFSKKQELPEWAKKFIVSVDSFCNTVITESQALQILEELGFKI